MATGGGGRGAGSGGSAVDQTGWDGWVRGPNVEEDRDMQRDAKKERGCPDARARDASGPTDRG